MDLSGYREMEEKISIRDTSRNLKKYGSTSRHMIRNDNLIKHIVSKTDTLAGIALKYGVTTEQIRRVNRLYASDSLFLREYLMVPLPKELVSSQSTDGFVNNNLTGANCSQIPNSTAGTPSESDDNSSINNFLAKMDSSIATVKKEIKKTQEHSSFSSEEDWHIHRRHNSTKNRHTHTYPSNGPSISEEFRASSDDDDVHDLPSAVVMTHGKKLKSSLQKLQEQQDEIFQL